jgi:hypothetical protein
VSSLPDPERLGVQDVAFVQAQPSGCASSEETMRSHLDTPGALQLEVTKSVAQMVRTSSRQDHTTIAGGYDAIACLARATGGLHR